MGSISQVDRGTGRCGRVPALLRVSEWVALAPCFLGKGGEIQANVE